MNEDNKELLCRLDAKEKIFKISLTKKRIIIYLGFSSLLSSLNKVVIFNNK